MDIELLDHLVIGQRRYVSLRERGLGFNSQEGREVGILPDIITQAVLDHWMGKPVVLLRLDPGALQTVRGAIDRLRQIGEETETATGRDLVKLDEEVADLREALSDVFTSALEDAGLVTGKGL